MTEEWVPDAERLRRSAVLADGLIPLGDEELDAALAGGLRRAELVGIYGTTSAGLAGARRMMGPFIASCMNRAGPVLYFALNDAAAAAQRDIMHRLRTAAPNVHAYAESVRGFTVGVIQDRAKSWIDRGHELHLVVIDQLDAVMPDQPETAQWEQEAQITRDLKAMTRIVDAPVIVTCTAARGSWRPLPVDPLVYAADVLIRTDGRYPTLVKNRHGVTNLHA